MTTNSTFGMAFARGFDGAGSSILTWPAAFRMKGMATTRSRGAARGAVAFVEQHRRRAR